MGYSNYVYCFFGKVAMCFYGTHNYICYYKFEIIRDYRYVLPHILNFIAADKYRYQLYVDVTLEI